jgi:hypothetical protein
MFSLQPPDFVAEFSEMSFLRLLGKLHNEKLSGSVFVSQSFNERDQRKDIYIKDGRLFHVASNDPQELLGEYLVSKGVLQRAQLDAALTHMAASKGQLGETLIALRLVDAVDVFTAIRNQGRDRVASLCGWQNGHAQFYRGAAPERVLFPLDLDITICMMWGAMRERFSAPPNAGKVVLGPCAPPPGAKFSSVAILNLVPSLARKQASLHSSRVELEALSRSRPELATLQAEAALVVAESLNWIRFA